jgi:hypothetical protein
MCRMLAVAPATLQTNEGKTAPMSVDILGSVPKLIAQERLF